MKPHQKHSKLAKPHAGVFARNEWAILGTSCGNIQDLAKKLAGHLGKHFNFGFADADHKSADEEDGQPIFQAKFTDKISFKRFDFSGQETGGFQFREKFNDVDLAIINGNHFQASRQIVALDPKKMESLARKLDRLTAVDAFLVFPDSVPVLPDFLKKQLPDWEKAPVIPFNAPEEIAHFLITATSPPPLLGLVLAGGKSTRMGEDKGLMDWHGQPQRERLAGILESLRVPAFFSGRAEQAAQFADSQRFIADSFLDLGPFGALLSAFRQRPDAAWLVLACDLPMLDAATLKFLIDNRRTTAVATAFKSPTDENAFPEPLITIWEPKAYLHLLRFLAQGVSCPRKVLINSGCHLLDAPVPLTLTNVNTPEEASFWREKLTQREFGNFLTFFNPTPNPSPTGRGISALVASIIKEM